MRNSVPRAARRVASSAHSSFFNEGPDASSAGPLLRFGARADASSSGHWGERFARHITALLDRRLVGRVYGGYRLEAVLGQGRFGTCFAARDVRQTDAPAVAMKLVKPRRGGVDLDAVWAECAALSMLDCSQVPCWLGIVHEEALAVDDVSAPGAAQCPYFVVESLCPGVSLSARLKARERFSDAEITRIGASLLHAMAHCHERGVVHGDIRPANVLATDAGEASLIDFGLARFAKRDLTPAQRVMASAPDLEGFAETLVFLLYSDPARVTRKREATWREELALEDAQRALLLDLFADPAAFSSFDEVAARFRDAFGEA